MRSKADWQVSDGAAQERILSLLNDLPPEGIAAAEQFVRFLHEMAQHGLPMHPASQQTDRSEFAHPTIALPPSSLHAWSNLIEGYTGDALVDTEAQYADV